MNKLISVIVPVYNVEKHLDRCIESIVNQTYKNLEILLVDDGSPDNCPQKCDDWAKKDKRIRVIHKSNGGLSSARNVGIDAANGEYLNFVDSDDWIATDLFEKVMAIFEDKDPDIVNFNCSRINEKGEIYAFTEKVGDGLLTSEEALKELLKGNINNYAINKVYKKRVFEGIRFPEGRLWEDMAICYKLLLNSSGIYCCSEPFYFYFTRSDSISKIMNEKALCGIFLARYECHMTVAERCPSVQSFSMPLAALSARRLYDRSLWKDVDKDTLNLAKNFLEDNRENILKDINDKKYWLYFNIPWLYRLLRRARHKIGVVLKKTSSK